MYWKFRVRTLSNTAGIYFLKTIVVDHKRHGGKRYWIVNYAGSQIFINTFSHLSRRDRQWPINIELIEGLLTNYDLTCSCAPTINIGVSQDLYVKMIVPKTIP